MGEKAIRKYDKHLKPLRGFNESPEAHRRVEKMKDEKLAKAKRKEAKRRLIADGFQVGKFVDHIQRRLEQSKDRKG